jgi:tetratricopeptide (TPR) repeat protein
LQVWPDSADTLLLAARIARRSNDYEKADARLTLCQKLTGPGPSISFERELLLAQQGTFSAGVVGSLRRRQAEHPEDAVAIWEALSEGYLRTFRLNDLLESTSAWLEQQPNDSLAYFRRGWAYEHLEMIVEAEKDLRRVVELDPANDDAQHQLARLLLRAGTPGEAAALLERLGERYPGNSSVALDLAKAESQLGRYEEARTLLERLAVQYPRDPLVLVERGRVARQLGQTAEAESLLRQAVAEAPFNLDAHYCLWECLLARGKTAEAEQCQLRLKQIQADEVRIKKLSQALQNKPTDPNLRCEIGEAYLHLGKEEIGLGWLRGALQVDPRHSQAHRALFEYYTRNGQTALAAPHRPFTQNPDTVPAP